MLISFTFYVGAATASILFVTAFTGAAVVTALVAGTVICVLAVI